MSDVPIRELDVRDALQFSPPTTAVGLLQRGQNSNLSPDSNGFNGFNLAEDLKLHTLPSGRQLLRVLPPAHL